MPELRYSPTPENIERRTRNNGTVWNVSDADLLEHAREHISALRDELDGLERLLNTGDPSWEMCHNLSGMWYDVHDMRKELGENLY